ncbi:hypothetical protein L202_05316 [Cryptococcus amylolentus CBS 6039]|uniref:Methyltransferase type 11 domain-containing protein n=2 Tax=Cryptococcus amylolentus TaxID=104669 RepID=A0A1E3HLU1_9TREE|nr:hypothetical protein L202_05316 [Cryptococcus amylolentus CBS 6039]ODN76676.1 hypothetical protein L202_05316 [Cryptococcus amylolentus CBS 6039]ODO04637.1 hypothetical protein I350_05246 [Cryptococcus amylolentus CBS 6273]
MSPISPIAPPILSFDSPHGEQLLGVPFGAPSAIAGIDQIQRMRDQDAMHHLMVEPTHSKYIHSHLAKVHASGRRSAVLDIGSLTSALSSTNTFPLALIDQSQYAVLRFPRPRRSRMWHQAGSWATALANKEPFADVVAIAADWKPFVRQRIIHGNLDVMTVDINQHLPYPAGSFDIIQVKSLARSHRQYPILVERLIRLLRRGGLLILVESHTCYENPTGMGLPTCLRTWDASVRSALAAQGYDARMASKLPFLVRGAGVFGNTAFVQEIGIPTTSYPQQGMNNIAQAGALHARTLPAEMSSFMPLLRQHGYDERAIQAMIDECLHCLLNPQARFLQRLVAVYAFKMV